MIGPPDRGRKKKHVCYRRLISPDANSLLFAKAVENVVNLEVADAELIRVSAACSQGRGSRQVLPKAKRRMARSGNWVLGAVLPQGSSES